MRLRPLLPTALFLSLAALGLLSLDERPAAAQDKPPSQSDDQLRARLEAGEFGPALDAAEKLDDLTEQVRQLSEIAGAQSAAGDFGGAAQTARKIPARPERSRAGGQIIRDRTRAGGGTQANFGPLMNLIETTVEPDSWEAIGGQGTMTPFVTGVYVDPQGLLRTLTRQERSGRLERISRRGRAADLNDDLARPSPLRFVSLTRLERAVAERLATGQPALETMRRLAGLTRLRYVLADQASREILIAGPAEGWKYDVDGRPLGLVSGEPLLDLDDLVVAFRAFAPGGQRVFGCSINTRDENLKQVKEFVEASNRAGPLRPGQLQPWLAELQRLLGLQDIVVHGVAPETHVAQVLVEADYRMKLIGVAKLDGGPDIPSYFNLLREFRQTSGTPLEALRWWLTMNYDAVVHSPDRTVFELQGDSVRLQSENQFVSAQGQHVPTGVAEPVNRAFAQNFTRHYGELAKREPVFADLRNIFDMALAAALVRQEGLHERVGWNLGAFSPTGAYRPATVATPKVVESVINHRVYGGRDIVVQVAGGVQAEVATLAGDAKLAHESAELEKLAARGAPRPVDSGRWWWDAGE
ncbi:MAG: DUF1598 domain-containing protein [Planctomycetaceae bacterium]